MSLNVTQRTFKMFSNRQAWRRMECRLCVRDKSIYTFYTANPDVTARDVAKMKRLKGAVGELLDAAT